MKDNETSLRCNLDMLDKVQEAFHIKELPSKQHATRRYNFKEGDLVLWQVVAPTITEKFFFPTWKDLKN